MILGFSFSSYLFLILAVSLRNDEAIVVVEKVLGTSVFLKNKIGRGRTVKAKTPAQLLCHYLVVFHGRLR